VNHKIEIILPPHIKACFKFVNDIANEYSHINENELEKNLFISASFALIEILEWMPGFVSNNFSK
jgi:hypothetical protein